MSWYDIIWLWNRRLRYHRNRKILLLLLILVNVFSCAHSVKNYGETENTIKYNEIQFGSYHAIIIANNNYINYDKLSTPLNDAIKIKKILVSDYGFEVKLLLDATYSEIMDELNKIIDYPAENGNLLIYYSGHGGNDEKKDSYWMPIDADKDGNNRVYRSDIINMIHSARANHVLVIDDSCYSGSVVTADYNIDKNVVHAGSSTSEHKSKDDNTDIFDLEYYHRLSNARSEAWLSSGGHEHVSENGGDGHSIYAKYFIKALHNNSGVMNANYMFETIIRPQVIKYAKQTPQYIRILIHGGEFLFVSNTWSFENVDTDIGSIEIRMRMIGERKKIIPIKDIVVSEIKKVQLNKQDKLNNIASYNAEEGMYLFISIYRNETKLSLELIDKRNNDSLGKNTITLIDDRDRMTDGIRYMVYELLSTTQEDLKIKTISIGTVKSTLIAQRKKTMDYYLTTGISFYGEGLLDRPAMITRIGMDINMTDYAMIGITFGYETMNAENSQRLFIGDIDGGTYSDSSLVGGLSMHTFSVMCRLTLRKPYGLLLPYGFLEGGIAYHDLNLGDEYYEPSKTSETMPINIINERDSTYDWAPIIGIGGGVQLLLSKYAALTAHASIYKSFHDMIIRSRIKGVGQLKDMEEKFQPIQGLSISFGLVIQL